MTELRLESDIDVITLEFPAKQRYLNILSVTLAAVLERVEDLPEPKVTIYNVQLAAQEVCTNVVRHAYHGMVDANVKVTISLHNSARKLIIDVFDHGRSFDPDAVPEPDFDVGQAGGWGLFLIRELMDEVNYQTQSNMNQWSLVKNL